MVTRQFSFEYQEFDTVDMLPVPEQQLVLAARQVTLYSYSPYSNFKVGSALYLANGKMIAGTNQENASYAATICAERTLLATAHNLYPNEKIIMLAISYADKIHNTTPLAPCGICRQAILEQEIKNNHNITIVLSAYAGKVIVVQSIKHLLPLYFSKFNLI